MYIFKKKLVIWFTGQEVEIIQYPCSSKEKSSSRVSNYRPISLLSLVLVPKVFKRCFYNRLADHLLDQLYKLFKTWFSERQVHDFTAVKPSAK